MRTLAANFCWFWLGCSLAAAEAQPAPIPDHLYYNWTNSCEQQSTVLFEDHHFFANIQTYFPYSYTDLFWEDANYPHPLTMCDHNLKIVQERIKNADSLSSAFASFSEKCSALSAAASAADSSCSCLPYERRWGGVAPSDLRCIDSQVRESDLYIYDDAYELVPEFNGGAIFYCLCGKPGAQGVVTAVSDAQVALFGGE